MTEEKSVALFGAMYFELKPLLRRLKISRQWKEKETHIFESQWRGLPIFVVRTGVGKKNAEAAVRRLLESTTPSLGISMGLCGAVARHLRVGQTVLSTEVMELKTGDRFASLAMTESLSLRSPTKQSQGLLVTADSVLGRAEKEALQRRTPEALVCDMETAPLAAALRQKKIPFLSLRTVSDRWDCEFPPTEILVQKNSWRQIKMLIAHYQYRFPKEFCRLLKLGWDSRRAAKKNAKEVLKFLSFSIDTQNKKN